jgi:GTP:adenosylcobinamide-phosphate guanylyltransferase
MSATEEHTFLYVANDFFFIQSETIKFVTTAALHAAQTDTNRLTTFPSTEALWQLPLWILNAITIN